MVASGSTERTTWRRTWWVCVGINLVGGVPCLVGFLLWVAPATLGDATTASTAVFAATFAAYVAAIGLATSRKDQARQRQVERWLDVGAPTAGPAAAGRAIVLREPTRQAVSSGVVWLGGCALFAAIDLLYVGDALRSLLLLSGALMAALNTVAVTFFAAERMLRPLTALALADASADIENLFTVRRRLQLGWFVGSGVPISGIGLTLLWQEVMGTNMRGPLLALVVIGLLAGWVVMGVSGRSVAEPLEEVRAGLHQVESGDLTTSVTVSARTEIGRLQAGFNNMVAGLRERERIRHLFGAQVSPPVAASTIAGRITFEGRQVDVSVLFVDLIGSTSLVLDRSAPEVVAIVNVMIETVVGAVEAEGGIVTRIQGDGALCVFGAFDGPDAQHTGSTPRNEAGDHADRALSAALRLRGDLADLHATHADLDAGIAVASGPVVVGLVGTTNRHEFGLVGDPVNEAARLCDVAKQRPGRLLVAEPTITRASSASAAPWQPAARVALRGRSELTVAYEPAAYATATEAPE